MHLRGTNLLEQNLYQMTHDQKRINLGNLVMTTPPTQYILHFLSQGMKISATNQKGFFSIVPYYKYCRKIITDNL